MIFFRGQQVHQRRSGVLRRQRVRPQERVQRVLLQRRQDYLEVIYANYACKIHFDKH